MVAGCRDLKSQSETNLLLRSENDCVHVRFVKNVELWSLKLFQCLLRSLLSVRVMHTA